VPYLAPRDMEAGGTWIAVNALGLTLAITNQYPSPPSAPPADKVSRGLLVSEWIDSADINEVAARAESLDAERYEAFSLVALQPGRPVTVVDWDRRQIGLRQQEQPGFILTSSGAVPPNLEQVRRAVFQSAIARHGLTAEAMEWAHASHEPERGVLSVCMHREVAATVSLSAIQVDPHQIAFRYTPGPPCVTQPDNAVVLTRTVEPLRR